MTSESTTTDPTTERLWEFTWDPATDPIWVTLGGEDGDNGSYLDDDDDLFT